MKRYYTLSAFLKQYSSQNKCLKTIFLRKYPNGVTCKKCTKITKHYKLRNRPCYACSQCGTQIYPLAGTIFEKSTTPLPTWFYAIFLMTSTRAGISAKQLQRQTGVTYKTAWRMFHQIRKLMQSANPLGVSGVVEIDETYVGGKAKNNKRKSFGTINDKEVVMGMVERGGNVVVKHIESSGRIALFEQIHFHVKPNSQIMTDELQGYKLLSKYGFQHKFVKHGLYEYRKGDCYTQNIENVWSHFKRGIYGVYRKVSSKHLQKYADEFAFRYNNRHRPSEMFDVLLSQIS